MLVQECLKQKTYYKDSVYWKSFVFNMLSGTNVKFMIRELDIENASKYWEENIIDNYGYLPIDIVMSYCASIFDKGIADVVFENFIIFKEFVNESAFAYKIGSKSLNPFINYLRNVKGVMCKSEVFLSEKTKNGMRFIINHFLEEQ
ncbi:MAG: hypothetical protein NZZ41_07645 [Candidatus Dojkabacteria bacterium]|nr:hypothetical protein [Candidatus Dojkabacteria bacterium]